jgi:hypothetical protein
LKLLPGILQNSNIYFPMSGHSSGPLHTMLMLSPLPLLHTLLAPSESTDRSCTHMPWRSKSSTSTSFALTHSAWWPHQPLAPLRPAANEGCRVRHRAKGGLFLALMLARIPQGKQECPATPLGLPHVPLHFITVLETVTKELRDTCN